MPDGANTKHRNGRNVAKCKWYAIYRSARFRKRFGDFKKSRRAVLETARRRLRRALAS